MRTTSDSKRQQAIDNLTTLVEELHIESLENEQAELDGCKDAIDKANAILLDRGRPGVSLGLDSAVHAINNALAQTDRRLKKWTSALDGFGHQVDISMLQKAFPGVEERGGKFRAHLEIAAVAIALKCRVIVLQAVDYGQSDEDNSFEDFIQALKNDQSRVNNLEAGITAVLTRLSSLEITAPRGTWDRVMGRGDVDFLLRNARRIHELDAMAQPIGRDADVVVDIARHADGSIDVYPAEASVPA